MGEESLVQLIGRKVELPGHFVGSVSIESARPLGDGAEIRVRLATGELDEAVLSRDDLRVFDDEEGGGVVVEGQRQV